MDVLIFRNEAGVKGWKPFTSGFVAGCTTLLALVTLTPGTAAAATAQDPETVLTRAAALASAGSCSEARRDLAGIPDSTRDADQARYAVAECYVKKAQWQQAAATLQVLLRREPSYNPALFLHAYVLFRTHRYDASLTAISRYLAQAPADGQAHKIRGL